MSHLSNGGYAHQASTGDFLPGQSRQRCRRSGDTKCKPALWLARNNWLAYNGTVPVKENFSMAITYSMTKEGEIINDHHLIAQVLGEALPYINFLKGKTLVIKLGGSALEHQRIVLQDIVWLRALGANTVLVHGGGPYINEWLNKLNLPTHFENGLRVTDARTLEVVRMVLLGQVNQGLVLMTAQLGGKAIGLSGTDGGMVCARIADERLGFVGEIESVDPTLVHALIDQGYIPIVAPLGQGPEGVCLNINADLVAAHLASALQAE